MPVVLLLDIDDVLVLPVGYKRGIPATLETFTRRLGWEIPMPTEADIEWFEASGVTSEWDSTAICLAGLLLEAARLDEDWIVPDFEEAMARLAARALDSAQIRPNYVAWVKAAGEAAQPGERPSQAAWQLWRREVLPQLPRPEALEALLKILLANTHHLLCPTTAVFQTWMVGSRAYQEAYGRPAPIEVTRGLLEEDRPLLTREGARALIHVWYEGRLAPAFYTLRPSRPPLKEPAPPRPVYSPEAELAARQIGLEDWPPVGLGRLFWLAETVGLQENPSKPHLIHGMAAFASAIASVDGIPEPHALQSAYETLQIGTLIGPLAEWAEFPWHVVLVEDSVKGIQGVFRTVRRLYELGMSVRLTVFGVAPHPGPKAEALEAYADRLVPSVNDVIDEIVRLCRNG
ncbi:hypothetical protein [Thermoflexus sp.]|uniref:hypothetical protein n=1 Tax=Thermoflexus sp. TaxID=1969742 RepID=UPI002ADDD091|nr:hypothetical protein [Thermoflexus sp.]